MVVDIIKIQDIDFYSEGISLLNTLITNNGNFVLIKLDNLGIGEMFYTKDHILYDRDITYIKMEQENVREGLDLTAILATDLKMETVKEYINIIKDMVGKIRYSKAAKEQSDVIYKMLKDIQTRSTQVKFNKNRKIISFNQYDITVISLNVNTEYFIDTQDVYGDKCLDIKRILLSSNNNTTKDIVYVNGVDESIR